MNKMKPMKQNMVTEKFERQIKGEDNESLFISTICALITIVIKIFCSRMVPAEWSEWNICFFLQPAVGP